MKIKPVNKMAYPRGAKQLSCSLTIPVIVVFILTACSPATSTEAPPPSSPTIAVQPSETKPPAASATSESVMQLAPCSSAATVSLIQTAIPVTPTPTGSAPSASPTPAPATPTPRPAPSEDRVGFATGYQEDFKLMYIYDRLDNRQVRVVCGNDVAASVKQGEVFPYGSILVMETWRAKLDADSKLVKDSNGRLIRENLNGIFVMRKEQGFGEAYQDLRTGEWEYVAYRPDESHSTPPQNSANCAACHLGSSEEKDWVFRADVLFFDPDRYTAAPAPGENEIYINSMSFGPRTIKLKAGTKVTWTNHDVSSHTVTFDDGSVESGELTPGESYEFTFTAPGTYNYHCSMHPEQMKAVIEVEE
jgi:Cytochrome P460/Cupredoxin-like domain